eukprot:SAG31_NODE_2421_length_5725_cov_14.985605_5_plen_234_part_00
MDLDFSDYSPAKLKRPSGRSAGSGANVEPIDFSMNVYAKNLVTCRFKESGYHPSKMTAIALMKGLGFQGFRVNDPLGSGLDHEIVFFGFFKDPASTFTLGTDDRLIIDDDAHVLFSDLSKHFNKGEVVVGCKTKDNIDFGPKTVMSMCKVLRGNVSFFGDRDVRPLGDELGAKACYRLLDEFQKFAMCCRVARSDTDYAYVQSYSDELLPEHDDITVADAVAQHRARANQYQE